MLSKIRLVAETCVTRVDEAIKTHLTLLTSKNMMIILQILEYCNLNYNLKDNWNRVIDYHLYCNLPALSW